MRDTMCNEYLTILSVFIGMGRIEGGEAEFEWRYNYNVCYFSYFISLTELIVYNRFFCGTSQVIK